MTVQDRLKRIDDTIEFLELLKKEIVDNYTTNCNLCGKEVYILEEPIYPYGSGRACKDCKKTHNECPHIEGL